MNVTFSTTGFICYDDGCHLKKYACNPDRAKLTQTSQKIASTNIVVDKLHFRGHTDKWCQEYCNPHKFDELKLASFFSYTYSYMRVVL